MVTLSVSHFACITLLQEGGNFLVEDLSNNGTFVDGTLVGKGMKHPLVNNSVVSLAEERNRGAWRPGGPHQYQYYDGYCLVLSVAVFNSFCVSCRPLGRDRRE